MAELRFGAATLETVMALPVLSAGEELAPVPVQGSGDVVGGAATGKVPFLFSGQRELIGGIEGDGEGGG